MTTRSARRRGDTRPPKWEDIMARWGWCWCGSRAVQQVTVGGMVAPVCGRHRNPSKWPPELLVLIA